MAHCCMLATVQAFCVSVVESDVRCGVGGGSTGSASVDVASSMSAMHKHGMAALRCTHVYIRFKVQQCMAMPYLHAPWLGSTATQTSLRSHGRNTAVSSTFSLKWRHAIIILYMALLQHA
eukprot:TRINITY_DN372_c6_g1_i1.p1 TRINITY_DN372_c6_g1~~TRINITY_DN372_c6_g1_i1.p1  ORF type:complete len:120 (-),score=13.02 TRINITY_DN372_c6_g1_i1:127-486(-)